MRVAPHSRRSRLALLQPESGRGHGRVRRPPPRNQIGDCPNHPIGAEITIVNFLLIIE
jgi:hypothetical protein